MDNPPINRGIFVLLIWKFSMVYLWNKFKALRNYLAYQIFAYFALMIVLVLSLALALPKFDARIFNPIEDKELHFFNQESQNTQLEYN
ncbi:hypothetical protein HT653_08590, partial [Ursidibacter maritimus]|nr:hypothetical protein [Ursidibacter maritimus]